MTDPTVIDPRPPAARALELTAHPEGGWYRRIWCTGHALRPEGYPGERATATGIHYVLGPGEESAWHRVRSDELWLWHRGAPLALWIGGDGEAPDEGAAPVRLGAHLEDGELPALLVPAGHWQRARPVEEDEVLVSCVVSPGFDFADFTLRRGPDR